MRMLYKAGSVHDVSNYRGISLLDVMGKLYERVAYCRLEEQLVHRGALPEEMFGFISKHGQNHALYTAYESIKHNRRIGKTVVVCSADVRKAYPSMNRAQMLHELKQLGVGNNLFHAIASMYEDNRSQVLTSEDGVTSTEYSVENGLREGAVCSPLLYVVFCTGLIKKLKSGPTAALGALLRHGRHRRTPPGALGGTRQRDRTCGGIGPGTAQNCDPRNGSPQHAVEKCT